MSAQSNALYESYVRFKGWGPGGGSQEDEAFAQETARAGLRRPARILEVGFGDGRFLDWARAQGHKVTGVEIIEEMVWRARARGHDARLGTAEEAIGPEERFDAVVAFDVLEHLAPPQLARLLGFAAAALAPGGRFLARFPNGSSPFGLVYQASDATHLSVLNASVLRQLGLEAGLEVAWSGNSARAVRSGRRSPVLRRAAHLARDAIEVAIGMIYFGRRLPMDPMLTVVLARADEAPPAASGAAPDAPSAPWGGGR